MSFDSTAAEPLHAEVIDHTNFLQALNSVPNEFLMFRVDEPENECKLIAPQIAHADIIVDSLLEIIDPYFLIPVGLRIELLETGPFSIIDRDHLSGNSSFILEPSSGEQFLIDTRNFRQSKNGPHGINIGLKQHKMNVLIPSSWIDFPHPLVQFQ